MRQVSKVWIAATMALSGAQASADEIATAKHAIDYNLTIAGVSIGDADMLIDPWTLGSYSIDFSLSYRFLFWSGQSEGRALGMVGNAKPRPASYDVTFSGMSKPVVISTAFDEQGPVEWSIMPPPDKNYLVDRIAISEADLVGAIDPLSALVIRADSAATACDRTLPIFTGGTRLDLVLTPGAETETGVFDCGVQYVPVSGHRKDSESVARMIEKGPVLSIFEVAPGLWAPHRVGMPTKVGTLAMTRILPEDVN